MIDVDPNDYGNAPEMAQSHQMAKLLNGAGAVMSIALILGLGVWGYKLAVRDVTGVPVVRALEGPMRVAPDQPGGVAADHQGLAVNSVQAEGTAAAPADRLVLAPRPVLLTEEDLAGVRPVMRRDSTIETPATRATEAGEPVVLDDKPRVEPVSLIEDVTETDPVAAALALAEELAASVEPLSEVGDVEVAPEVEIVEADQKTGILRSPRPSARPDIDSTVRAVTEAVAAAAAPETSVDVDAASLSVGTNLAQLGAFDSEAVAVREWDRLNGRFAEYLDGKNRVIQKAQSGGRTFYRLRALGFADINDARRFCSALLAENAPCIPVVTR